MPYIHLDVVTYISSPTSSREGLKSFCFFFQKEALASFCANALARYPDTIPRAKANSSKPAEAMSTTNVLAVPVTR